MFYDSVFRFMLLLEINYSYILLIMIHISAASYMPGVAELTIHWTLSTGPVIPDDRNMLNENQPSPDRPTIQGKHTPGKGLCKVKKFQKSTKIG